MLVERFGKEVHDLMLTTLPKIDLADYAEEREDPAKANVKVQFAPVYAQSSYLAALEGDQLLVHSRCKRPMY